MSAFPYFKFMFILSKQTMVGFLHVAEKIFTGIIEQTSYLYNFSSKAVSVCFFEKGINFSCKFFIKCQGHASFLCFICTYATCGQQLVLSKAWQSYCNCSCCVQCLRQFGVSGKCVEFFGPGVSSLSILERTTVANMCPEYGAIVAFFPMDSFCLDYLQRSGNLLSLISSIHRVC